jgi:hypothetical protein
MLTRAMPSPTAAELSRRASFLYEGAGARRAQMQIWRRYIRPFELLFDHIPDGDAVLDAGFQLATKYQACPNDSSAAPNVKIQN